MKRQCRANRHLFAASVILFSLVLSNFSFASAISNYSLTYDGNGNLITGDGKYREYNGFNQLVRVRLGNTVSGHVVEEYIWHPVEDRILVKKINLNPLEGNTLDEMVVYVNDNFERVYDIGITRVANDTYYARDENGIVGEIKTSGTASKKLYYHPDHLGSTSVITNESGEIVEETFYDPYGAILEGGEASRYQYEGKEFSSATQDYDFHFRKYDPEIGIFTQPEQLFPNIYDPQQLNRYSFERNNPYKYVDESGKWIETAVDIGFVSYDISQLSTEEGRGEWVNWASLGVDVAFTALPFVTGGGALVRGGGGIVGGFLKGGDVSKVASKLTPREIGKIGEEQLLKTFGGKSQVPFDTSFGKRIFDQFSLGTARESKVGYQTLTASNKLQIDKTAELLSTGRISGAENYFFKSPVTGKGGASQNLLSYSESKGIKNIQKTGGGGGIINRVTSFFKRIF